MLNERSGQFHCCDAAAPSIAARNGGKLIIASFSHLISFFIFFTNETETKINTIMLIILIFKKMQQQ